MSDTRRMKLKGNMGVYTQSDSRQGLPPCVQGENINTGTGGPREFVSIMYGLMGGGGGGDGGFTNSD